MESRGEGIQRLGRYRILTRLGSGGMGTVYLGVHTGMAKFQKLVVLKLLHAECSRDPERVVMFLDEARLAAFNHRNVIQTLK